LTGTKYKINGEGGPHKGRRGSLLCTYIALRRADAIVSGGNSSVRATRLVPIDGQHVSDDPTAVGPVGTGHRQVGIHEPQRVRHRRSFYDWGPTHGTRARPFRVDHTAGARPADDVPVLAHAIKVDGRLVAHRTLGGPPDVLSDNFRFVRHGCGGGVRSLSSVRCYNMCITRRIRFPLRVQIAVFLLETDEHNKHFAHKSLATSLVTPSTDAIQHNMIPV